MLVIINNVEINGIFYWALRKEVLYKEGVIILKPYKFRFLFFSMSFQLCSTKILIMTLMLREKWSMHLVFLLLNVIPITTWGLNIMIFVLQMKRLKPKYFFTCLKSHQSGCIDI